MVISAPLSSSSPLVVASGHTSQGTGRSPPGGTSSTGPLSGLVLHPSGNRQELLLCLASIFASPSICRPFPCGTEERSADGRKTHRIGAFLLPFSLMVTAASRRVWLCHLAPAGRLARFLRAIAPPPVFMRNHEIRRTARPFAGGGLTVSFERPARGIPRVAVSSNLNCISRQVGASIRWDAVNPRQHAHVVPHIGQQFGRPEDLGVLSE